MFTDSHCHLTFPELAQDLPRIRQAMANATLPPMSMTAICVAWMTGTGGTKRAASAQLGAPKRSVPNVSAAKVWNAGASVITDVALRRPCAISSRMPRLTPGLMP